MSLLLQALKKAEEDKRRRAALAAAESEPLGAAFPALNLVDDEAAVPEPINTVGASKDAVTPNEWAFVPLATPDVAAEIKVDLGIAEAETSLPEFVSTTAPIEATELIDTAPTAIAAVEPLEIIRAAPVEPVMIQAMPSEPTPVEPVISALSSAEVEPVITPAAAPFNPAMAATASRVAPQALAKSLFAKRKGPAGRGLLPWLALGAGLLLAGMLAWFTWQYRQLTQPRPESLINPVASAPMAQNNDAGSVAEPVAVEALELDTPVANVAPAATALITPVVKPPESLVSNVKSAPLAANEGSELNPPVKFIRQSPNLSAPEPVLLAWQAYQNGDFAQAERIYRKVLLTDPRQRDALLGLAAIAQQRGDLVEADALYRRLLRFNPQDDSAKAALLGLNSAQMPEKDAVQLEQSGQSDPLVLGHYFAAQQRWSQAQEQFFLAYNANPNSADAALNLAVSLDHLNQTALARDYYRKALQAKEQINFDRSKVEQRLLELDTAGQKP